MNNISSDNTGNAAINIPRVINPFNTIAATQMQTSSALSDQQRSVSEVQALMIIAKNYPRDTVKAMDKILNSCSRLSLAEIGLYSYPRGGMEVTGASIRLAEAIVQDWGNILFCVRELSNFNGKSLVQSSAWDLETNIKAVKEFEVVHSRYTKKSSYQLSDPRDIYETVANAAARRLRACIFSIIPRDVIDSAIKQCEMTLKEKTDVSDDAKAKMVDLFLNKFSVSREMIEKRIGRSIFTISPMQLISMRKIYNSLSDKISTVDQWFEVEKNAQQKEEIKTNTEKAIEILS